MMLLPFMCANQIIAMADSGLDMKSCFFREDDSADNIDCSDYNSPVYDLTKRKVCRPPRSIVGADKRFVHTPGKRAFLCATTRSVVPVFAIVLRNLQLWPYYLIAPAGRRLPPLRGGG